MRNYLPLVGVLTVLASFALPGSLLGLPDAAHWIDCKPDAVPAEAAAASTSGKQPPSPTLKVDDLLPAWSERFWSGFNVKLEFLDQEDFFIEDVTLPPRTPDGPDREVGIFQPNPDRYLWKTTVAIDLSKFFRSPAQFKDAYTAVADNPGWFSRSSDPLSVESPEGPVVELFARARNKDRTARILSGISGYVAVADRPRLRGGEPLPQDVLDEDGYDETYGFKIDPAKWFVTGSDWASAYASTLAYARAYGKPEALRFAHPCSGQIDRSCLERRARRTATERFLSTVLPVFEFKAVDQFDFIQRAGGPYLTTPLLDDTLETYTLTWDLSRSFGGAKERIEAVTALVALKKMQSDGPPTIVWTEATRVPVAAGELLYLQFESKGGVAPSKWTRSVVGCETATDGEILPGAKLSESGLLLGHPRKVPAACKFIVRVADSVGQAASLTCSIGKVAASAAH